MSARYAEQRSVSVMIRGVSRGIVPSLVALVVVATVRSIALGSGVVDIFDTVLIGRNWQETTGDG